MSHDNMEETTVATTATTATTDINNRVDAISGEQLFGDCWVVVFSPVATTKQILSFQKVTALADEGGGVEVFQGLGQYDCLSEEMYQAFRKIVDGFLKKNCVKGEIRVVRFSTLKAEFDSLSPVAGANARQCFCCGKPAIGVILSEGRLNGLGVGKHLVERARLLGYDVDDPRTRWVSELILAKENNSALTLSPAPQTVSGQRVYKTHRGNNAAASFSKFIPQAFLKSFYTYDEKGKPVRGDDNRPLLNPDPRGMHLDESEVTLFKGESDLAPYLFGCWGRVEILEILAQADAEWSSLPEDAQNVTCAITLIPIKGDARTLSLSVGGRFSGRKICGRAFVQYFARHLGGSGNLDMLVDAGRTTEDTSRGYSKVVGGGSGLGNAPKVTISGAMITRAEFDQALASITHGPAKSAQKKGKAPQGRGDDF